MMWHLYHDVGGYNSQLAQKHNINNLMYGPWYLGVHWREQRYPPAYPGLRPSRILWFQWRSFRVPRIMMPQQEDYQWTVADVIH